MAKLGDFLTSINLTKNNLLADDPLAEKEYVPFVINRSLSYFVDTIGYANEMNLRGHADNRLQNDYLLHSIRKKKRFSRWIKKDNNEDIDAIKEYYSCSYRKACEIIKLLSEDQMSTIHRRLDKGGFGKRGV